MKIFVGGSRELHRFSKRAEAKLLEYARWLIRGWKISLRTLRIRLLSGRS